MTGFQVGDWRVEPGRDKIFNDQGSVDIRPKVMDLLVVLARQPSRVFTVEELLAEVWPDTVTLPASVYNCLKELRAALRDDPHRPRYIETIPKRGYRLIAPVRPLAATGGQDSDAYRHRSGFWSWWPISPAITAGLALLLFALMAVLALKQTAEPDGSPGFSSGGRYIAVLPLEVTGADGSLDHLGEGFSRAIIDDLAEIPGLRVIAHESSFRFGGGGESERIIGERLGADLLVTGNIRESGGEITVDVRLSDTQTGQEIWRRKILASPLELHSARSRLGSVVTAAFLDGAGTGIPDPATSPRMLDTEAYDLFLKARKLVDMNREQSLREAMEVLELVLETEPGFARAASLKLDARWRLYFSFETTWPAGLVSDLATHLSYRQGLLDEARRLAQAQPSLAEAQLLLGRNLRFSRRYDEAQQALERSLSLNPSLGEAHRELGWLNRNRHGSWAVTVDHFRRAVSLNPYSQELRTVLIRGLSNVADLREEMWRVVRDTKERLPWTPDVGISESMALVSEGRYADAVRVLEDALDRTDDPRIRASLAEQWYALDRPDRSRQLEADYESWRVERDERMVDVANRCPASAAGREPALLLWSAYVCAIRRQPQRTYDLLQEKFGQPRDLASGAEAMLGSEWSAAVLMAWASRATGRQALASSYAQVEDRVINSRSANGQLQSGNHFMLAARVAAVSGDAARVFESLESMLKMGKLHPHALGHPAFDEYRDSPEFQALVWRRAELVQTQLAMLGLPPSG